MSNIYNNRTEYKHPFVCLILHRRRSRTGCRGNILPKSPTFGACCCFYICIQFRYIESFFQSIICSFHSYRPSDSIPGSIKNISLVYSKFFLARSPPIHMMRYCFAGLRLFMLTETHSHRRIPSYHNYKLLSNLQSGSKNIFAGRIILLRTAVTIIGPRATEWVAAM